MKIQIQIQIRPSFIYIVFSLIFSIKCLSLPFRSFFPSSFFPHSISLSPLSFYMSLALLWTVGPCFFNLLGRAKHKELSGKSCKKQQRDYPHILFSKRVENKLLQPFQYVLSKRKLLYIMYLHIMYFCIYIVCPRSIVHNLLDIQFTYMHLF